MLLGIPIFWLRKANNFKSSYHEPNDLVLTFENVYVGSAAGLLHGALRCRFCTPEDRVNCCTFYSIHAHLIKYKSQIKEFSLLFACLVVVVHFWRLPFERAQEESSFEKLSKIVAFLRLTFSNCLLYFF